MQFLTGWYIAIILPRQGLTTLALLPQSISVWRPRLVGFWQLLSGWVNPFWSGVRQGEKGLSGGNCERSWCCCCGEITPWIMCWVQDLRACVLILLCISVNCFSCKGFRRKEPGVNALVGRKRRSRAVCVQRLTFIIEGLYDWCHVNSYWVWVNTTIRSTWVGIFQPTRDQIPFLIRRLGSVNYSSIGER